MMNFDFLHPRFFWLFLLLIPVIWWFYSKRHTASARLKISDTNGFKTETSWKTKGRYILPFLRLLALSFLIVALARPVNRSVNTKTKTSRGIDIVMAIDISASMLAEDLRPNRLKALKLVAERFVNQRPNDRIGIVAYAGESYSKTPITSDKDVVIRTIKDLEWGELEGGTAIGMGLGSAINRIKNSKAKSKVIILLTDGVNNSGFIDPITASKMAQELGIKVYTIGIGTNGMARFPVGRRANGSLIFQRQPVEIDEALLKQVAKNTGGLYFRATSNSKLQEIYDEINKMEKTDVEEIKYEIFEKLYRQWVLWALALVVIEYILRKTVFKSFI
ncbi:MAG: aerotolerance regulator BatA [Flavobacteriales bacterium]|nr:MAG: aerotolerance regulator BatA [Flavobacteriales bacterium]